MNGNHRVSWTLVLLCSGLVLLSGCGGGDDGADPLDIVGTWQITAAGYEGVAPPMTVTITSHTGPTAVTATATGGGGYVTGAVVTTEGMPGVESPRGITITINFSDGAWASFAGTVDDDNAGMSGSYTNSQGFSGGWSAMRV